MANPFTTGPFNCCTCPEPPDYDPEVDDPLDTYVNLCGCPTVDVECVSEEKDATLCGHSEFVDNDASPPIVASVPPKKYLKQTETRQPSGQTWTCCLGPEVKTRSILTLIREYSDTITYDPETCTSSRVFDLGETESKTYDCNGNVTSTTTGDAVGISVDVEVTTTTTKTGNRTTELFQGTGACTPPSYLRSTASNTKTFTLSNEDTEAAALARATPTAGTSCSSIYELRTDSFSLTVRTSAYTLTASNLIVGKEYQGCVRLQRRESYSGTVPPGANTDWEDVEPDTIAAFTATDTEMEIATDVDLPGGTLATAGYEYKIVEAYIWPTSAGCSCPTDYVAP